MKKKGAKGKRAKNAEGPSFELVLGGNQLVEEQASSSQAASASTQD